MILNYKSVSWTEPLKNVDKKGTQKDSDEGYGDNQNSKYYSSKTSLMKDGIYTNHSNNIWRL